MAEQMIISIGREYGSGGHVVGQMLAERFGIDYYDANLIRHLAVEKSLDAEELLKYDEVPKSLLLSRRVMGHSSSPEENVAQMQFDYLRKMAESGKSFVIVGRCAESVLSDFDCMTSFFIMADLDKKIDYVCKKENLDRASAEAKIRHMDRKRRAYHNFYSAMKWGDSRNYDVCVNLSKLGLKKTADYLEQYIKLTSK